MNEVAGEVDNTHLTTIDQSSSLKRGVKLHKHLTQQGCCLVASCKRCAMMVNMFAGHINNIDIVTVDDCRGEAPAAVGEANNTRQWRGR
jgi:hypothetical protein